MHFSTILLQAALCSFAVAQSACTGDPSKKGYCTPLTYVDKTGSGSPSMAQCEDTCGGVIGDPSEWGVDFKGKPAGYVDHMMHYPCGFSVTRQDGDTADVSFSMINQDIIELIGETINQFGGAHGGNVAAEGTMECEGHTYKWIVG